MRKTSYRKFVEEQIKKPDVINVETREDSVVIDYGYCKVTIYKDAFRDEDKDK